MESYSHSTSHSLISTINDVLAKSLNTPLTPQEMKLTTSLVRSQESHGILEVKTGGQVYNVVDSNIHMLTIKLHSATFVSLEASSGLKCSIQGDHQSPHS